MPFDLYYLDGSPPCRTLLLAAKALGLEFNMKFVDFTTGAHLKPEFLKLNPMHQVPVLDDNGFLLTESRAILQYLVDAHGQGHESLYPKDPKKRYLVDKLLNFDLGTLYPSFADLYYPMIFAQSKLDPVKEKRLGESLGFLQGFLSGSDYAAGNEITIADFTLVSTLSSFGTIHDLSGYPVIVAYIERCKANMVGYSEVPGVAEFEAFAKEGLEKALKA